MGLGVRLKYETLRSVDTAALSGAYVVFGTPLSNPAAIYKIVNNSNVAVTISENGMDDHDIIPAGTFVLYDCTSNRVDGSGGLYKPKNTQFYVKSAAGTGLVYLVSQFAQEALSA